MDWKLIDDAARTGDVMLVRKAPYGETYAAFWGLARKTAACGADPDYPWVFLDSTNGTNCVGGITHYAPLPQIRRDPGEQLNGER